MPCCSAVGCSNRSERGFRLFKFPANPERRRMWLDNCKRENWTPTQSSFLCEVHFEPDQYEQHRADGRKLLKPFAIPTIFSHKHQPKKLKQVHNYSPIVLTVKETLSGTNSDHTYPSSLPIRSESNKSTAYLHAEVTAPGKLKARARDHLEPVTQNNQQTMSNIRPMVEVITPNLYEGFWEHSPSGLISYHENSFREILGDIQTEPVNNDLNITTILQSIQQKPESETDKLRAQVKKLKAKLRFYKKRQRRKVKPVDFSQNNTKVDLNQLHRLAERQDTTASFLLNQVLVLLKKETFSSASICSCLKWISHSPKGYTFAKKNQLLKLPSKYVLKNYLHVLNESKFGLSSNMKQRLSSGTLAPKDDNLATLVIEQHPLQKDWSDIKAMFFGNHLCLSNNESPDSLFDIQLQNPLRKTPIPVGYFFVGNFDNTKIVNFLLNVITELESLCFKIVRVVAPDTKSLPLTLLSSNSPKIIHPYDSNRFMYFNYNVNKIIHEVLQELITKDIATVDGHISSRYLQNIQSILRDPKQQLTHLGLLHKIQIPESSQLDLRESEHCFSFEMANILDLIVASGHSQFTNAKPTVKFIRSMSYWLKIQKEIENNLIVNSVNCIEKLNWLEVNFTNYLSELDQHCKENQIQFLNEDLFMRLRWTTTSSIAYLKDIVSV